MIKIRGNSIKIQIPHCFTTTLQGNLKLWDECLTWKCKRLLRESERRPQPDRSLLRLLLGLLLLFLVMLWWWYLLLWLSRWTVLVGECRKASDALPPARRAPVPPGRWEGVGSLPTASHRPGGTPPSEGGVPPPRWAEPNYPSVINKPAATRPDASDNSMTEATSMVWRTMTICRASY